MNSIPCFSIQWPDAIIKYSSYSVFTCQKLTSKTSPGNGHPNNNFIMQIHFCNSNLHALMHYTLADIYQNFPNTVFQSRLMMMMINSSYSSKQFLKHLLHSKKSFFNSILLLPVSNDFTHVPEIEGNHEKKISLQITELNFRLLDAVCINWLCEIWGFCNPKNFYQIESWM